MGPVHVIMRQRLEKSFDSFTDVQSMSDRDIALQARQDKIDIAVDLNGYTQYARTGIFAYRAAPIQIKLFRLSRINGGRIHRLHRS